MEIRLTGAPLNLAASYEDVFNEGALTPVKPSRPSNRVGWGVIAITEGAGAASVLIKPKLVGSGAVS